jgi:hypothetical protein
VDDLLTGENTAGLDLQLRPPNLTIRNFYIGRSRSDKLEQNARLGSNPTKGKALQCHGTDQQNRSARGPKQDLLEQTREKVPEGAAMALMSRTGCLWCAVLKVISFGPQAVVIRVKVRHNL